MKPTIGRIVIYNTTDQERKEMDPHGNAPKQLPAIIVAVWGEAETSAVNLKVFLDGTRDMLWKTTVNWGFNEGMCNWPARV